MTRTNYRRELFASFFLPFILAAVEGGIVGVIVKLGFVDRVPAGRLNVIVAVLTSAPAFANITSFVWVRFSHGRDKVRFIARLQAVSLLLALAIAVLPRNEPGLYMLAACVVLARMHWAGFVTLRSTVWRMNYPGSARARITGKFMMLQILLIAMIGLGLGLAMDHWDSSYRVLIPIGCALGVVGVLAWRKVRVRGQRRLLKEERASRRTVDGPSLNPLMMLGVLVRDLRFGVYMACQMLLGIGNLMLVPLIPIVLADRFEVRYFEGIILSNSIPLLMMPLTIPLWARLLDRVHVVRYRAVHSWLFVVAISCMAAGVYQGRIEWFYAAAMIRGAGFGGGVLAWNLGHLDFAPPHLASQYMGIHVTLTGLRGLTMPLVGVWIYGVLEQARPGDGWVLFAACAAVAAMGGLGFVLFALVMGRGERRTNPVEVSPPSRLES